MSSRRRSVLIAGVFGLVVLVAGVPAAPLLAAIPPGRFIASTKAAAGWSWRSAATVDSW